MPGPSEPPSVSVIMAVLDEAEHIDAVMADLTGQDYPGKYEIVVADGGSTDGTREALASWAERDPRVKVVDNPRRRQAYGLNLAADVASGEYLVRADGHTQFAPDYVRASVEVALETGGAAGGRMYPEGRGRFSRAVAAAMLSPLTMGPGRFHHAVTREEVDTVYLGAFPRERFLELGGLRAFPSGTSEDADFYFRWRREGGKVFVDPSIVSRYTPRDRPGALWRQYFRYGMGKAEMLWANGRLPSWRPLAPLGLLLGLVGGVVAWAVFGLWWPLPILLMSWTLVVGYGALASDARTSLLFVAAGIMHLAYGFGMVWGLVRFRMRSDSRHGVGSG